MAKNVFPLHVSTNFVCPGKSETCPIRARIRDFGSCVIRTFSIESVMPRRGSDRPRHEPTVRGEYLVKECAECAFNKVAQDVIRELKHPSAAPRIRRGKDEYDYHDE